MPRRTRAGKLLEELVRCIQDALKDHPSTTVRQNVKIQDLDGEYVEVDVLVEAVVSEQLAIRVVFECREHKRRVEKKQIQAFHVNCERLPAHKKVFVSSRGYQRGAKTKARQFNIKLLELRPLTDADSNTRKIRDLFSILGSRQELLGAGVYCPEMPEGASVSFTTLYLADRSTTIPTKDLALQLVQREPPSTDDVPYGHYVKRTGRFKLDPATYFVKYQEQFYEVLGIEVRVRIIRGLPVSPPQRLVTTDENEPHADIVAFRMPMLNGVGTVGSVVSSKTNDVKHFFELPPGVRLLSTESHFYIKYQPPGSSEIREVALSTSSANVHGVGLRLKFDLKKVVPEGSTILDAHLVNGPALPFEWDLTSLKIDYEGPDKLSEVDVQNWYFGPDRRPFNARSLLQDALMTNLPPVDAMPLGVIRSTGFAVTCLDDLFLKADGGFYRILGAFATIEYRRLPTPHRDASSPT